MLNGKYYIVNEATEDRFDETQNLDDAVRIARRVVEASPAGEPVSIEHNGRVVRQFVLTHEGAIVEPSVS